MTPARVARGTDPQRRQAPPRRRHAAAAWALAVASGLAAPARADEIELTSGEVIAGRIVGETEGRVMIRLADGGSLWVDRQAIAGVRRSPPSAPPGPPTRPPPESGATTADGPAIAAAMAGQAVLLPRLAVRYLADLDEFHVSRRPRERSSLDVLVLDVDWEPFLDRLKREGRAAWPDRAARAALVERYHGALFLRRYRVLDARPLADGFVDLVLEPLGSTGSSFASEWETVTTRLDSQPPVGARLRVASIVLFRIDEVEGLLAADDPWSHDDFVRALEWRWARPAGAAKHAPPAWAEVDAGAEAPPPGR